MPKGGIRTDSQGRTDHLYSPKWRLGKTTAIRIPAILKHKLLELAKYLDTKQIKEVESLNVIQTIENNSELNNRTFKLHNEVVKLNRDIDMLTHINEDLREQLAKISKKSRYQIAVECFEEFIKSQNLNMEDLSKSRKGTKKHQLFEIDQWLKNQPDNAA